MTVPPRVVHRRRAAPGVVCDVSRCTTEHGDPSPASVLLGWAPAGAEPRAWYPYCARHARAHLPAGFTATARPAPRAVEPDEWPEMNQDPPPPEPGRLF